jgi:hypothetical protein
MSDLYGLQKEFASAVTNPDRPVPGAIRGTARCRAEWRFAVYRNNVMVGLVDALATRFPVTLRLVGEEFFRAMARAYVEREPPRSPIMLLYGETFPAFIANFGPASTIPYLDAVASLEMARGRAYHAANAKPLAAADFAALSAKRLSETKVRLHPSVSVLSSRFPVVSIWEAHQGAADPAPLDSWEAEDALVSRPFNEVEVSRLPPGVEAFLREVAGCATIGAAAEAARRADDRFDPTAAFAVLIGANLAIDLR